MMSPLTRDPTLLRRAVLLDWGDTVMRDLPDYEGPMADWPRVEVVPGIESALRRLRPEWILALATNAADSEEDAIWRALARAGLSELFDHVFCFRRLGHRKPSEPFFRSILEELGLPATSVVMVGDRWESDIEGAGKVGIAGVWLHPEGRERRSGPGRETVHSLEDLPAAVQDVVRLAVNQDSKEN